MKWIRCPREYRTIGPAHSIEVCIHRECECADLEIGLLELAEEEGKQNESEDE